MHPVDLCAPEPEHYPSGVFYRSGYSNVYLCGRLEDGRVCIIMCGLHGRHYPYRDARSEFSDLLMVVGNCSYALVRPVLSNLRLSLGPKEQATVGFHGDALNDAGESVNIDLELNLFASRHAARVKGLGAGRLALGLTWEPALIVGTGSLTIGNERRRIVRGVGEMERGRLTSLRGERFQFGYEYSAAARCEGSPAAHVQFRSYPLHNDRRGALLRMVFRLKPATESVTLEGHELVAGDTHQLQPVSDAEVVVGHEIDLGPAVLTREIVFWQPSTPRYGFRERIQAKPV